MDTSKEFEKYFLDFLEKNAWTQCSEEEYEENKLDSKNYAMLIRKDTNEKSYAKRVIKN